jgi:hypothetical protein
MEKWRQELSAKPVYRCCSPSAVGESSRRSFQPKPAAVNDSLLHAGSGERNLAPNSNLLAHRH